MSTPVALTSPSAATLRRHGPQTWGMDGRAGSAVLSEEVVVVVVAPTTARQREMLPDGLRTSRSISVLAYTEIRAADQRFGVPADEVVVGDVAYEVHTVDEWPAIGPIPRSWQATCVIRAEMAR